VGEKLAEIAHYVGVTNGNDLQVFAVGCAADSCESILKDFPALIVDPKFKIGIELSSREIQSLGLRPNDYKKVV
jgi:hypothetical protein